jgi:hypothetical protein
MLLAELRPRGDNQQQRSLGSRQQPLEHVDHRRARPVEVLDHEDDRALRSQGGDESRPGPGQLVGHGLRLETVERVTGQSDAGRDRQRVGGLLDVVRRERLLDGLGELGPGFLGGLAERDPRGLPKHLPERPVGDPLPGREAAPPEDGRGLGHRLHEPDELERQPRLADPGRPEHGDQPRPPGLDRLVEERDERQKLPVPPDHRRLKPGHSAGGLGQGFDETPHEERLGLPLELERGGSLEPKRVAGGQVRPRPDQCGAGLGRLLQPGGDVDRIPGDETLIARAGGRREHLPGVDPDPDLKRHPVPVGELGVEVVEPRQHVERRPQRPFGVVLPHHREAEHGHHRVSDELLHGPAPRLDDGGHGGEVGGERRLQPFGIQPLAERGRAGDVGEQDGGEPALLADRLGGKRRRTVRTEPKRVGTLGAARGADQHPAEESMSPGCQPPRHRRTVAGSDAGVPDSRSRSPKGRTDRGGL